MAADFPKPEYLPRLSPLLLLTAATFAGTYGRLTLGPLVESMRTSLTLSDNQLALMQGPALAAPMALASIPIGLLIDRYSRTRLLVAFTALSLLATVLTAFVSSLPLLFMARFLAGLASAGILVAVFSLLADLYAPAQRGRATMVTLFGEIGGAPAAFALGGILLAMSPKEASYGVESWRWALLWMCTVFLVALLLLLMLREPPRTGWVVKNTQPVRAVWPQFWRYRSLVVPLLLARIMVWIADGAVLVWGAPVLSRDFDLSPDRVGAIIATALLVGGILGPVLGGPLADYCQRTGGPRRTMGAMCIVALLSVPAALFALTTSPIWAAFMLAAFLTFGFTIATAATALATIVVPGELRGFFIALSITVGATFSFGLAPLVVSGVSGALGGTGQLATALALVCGITSLLGALVFGFGKRFFPTHAAEEPHPAGGGHSCGPMRCRTVALKVD